MGQSRPIMTITLYNTEHFVRTCVFLEQFTLCLRPKFIRHWCIIQSFQFHIKFLVLYICYVLCQSYNLCSYPKHNFKCSNNYIPQFAHLFQYLSRNVSGPNVLISTFSKTGELRGVIDK